MYRDQPARRMAQKGFQPNSSHKKLTPRQRAGGDRPGKKGGKGGKRFKWSC